MKKPCTNQLFYLTAYKQNNIHKGKIIKPLIPSPPNRSCDVSLGHSQTTLTHIILIMLK